MAKRLNKNELRDNFLFESNLTKRQILVDVREYDSPEVATREIFSYDKNGDMKIIYPTLDGHIQRYNKAGKYEETYRLRKALPFLNKQGKEVKYLMQGNICAFFPPEMLEAYRKKREIEVLTVTEGEKKAFVACKNGFDCVGISGIWCYKVSDDKDKKEQGEMLPELRDFLKVCKVKRVVLLHDSDALDMTDTSKSRNHGKPLTARPQNFCDSAKYFCELVFQEGLKFSYSYINPRLSESGQKYGLDDLILCFENYEERLVNDRAESLPRVLTDFYESVSEGKSTTYFCTKNITQNKAVFWKDIFHLNDPKEFYQYHKRKLANITEFRFDARKFKINADGSIEEVKSNERDRVWIDDGKYVGEDQKGHPRVFTNFTMNVLFLLISATNPKRIVYFKNVLGQEAIKELTMDDLVSVSNFRKKLIANGSFIYKGDMFELLNLQEILFKEEKIAIELNSLGWQKQHGFFAFSNGITNDGKFYPIDEYGIVNWVDKKFYLPAYSSLHDEGDIAYENERNFKHIIEHEITFEDWATRFLQVYDVNGTVGICFYVSSLFRDIIYPIYKEFPLLNLFGQKGGGKSTMAKSLMSMFGVPQNAINIESGTSTSKAIQRKQAQIRNALVWIDEYKNSIDPKSVAMLKGLYDGVGYERAQTSQDNKTTNTPVLSSTILSGQDMPTIDPALFTRVILLMFKKNQFTEDEQLKYNQLKEIEKKGLTSITIMLLGNRELIKEHYVKEFKFWSKKFNKAFLTKEIPDRLWKSAAMILAPMAILIDHKVINPHAIKNEFTKTALFNNFLSVLEQHRNLLKDNQEISVFWETIETLFEEGIVTPERGHFRFVEDCLVIRYTPVYSAYAEKYRRINGRSGLDKQTLLNYLKASPMFKGSRDIRFENSNTSGYFFLYKELGINLVKLSVPSKDEESTVKMPLEENPIIQGATNDADLPY